MIQVQTQLARRLNVSMHLLRIQQFGAGIETPLFRRSLTCHYIQRIYSQQPPKHWIGWPMVVAEVADDLLPCLRVVAGNAVV